MTPTIFPLNDGPRLDPDLFRDPPAQFRGVPFWSWNGKLEPEQIRNQIAAFQEMGMGGFHLHCRTGLEVPYLSDAFMDLVATSVQEANSRGMRCWLYDEDRWPSGYGGGHVTRDPRFRQRHLLWTPWPYGSHSDTDDGNWAGALARRHENGRFVAAYRVDLRDGWLRGFERLATHDGLNDDAEPGVWYAYLESATPTPWFNNQTYSDNLNPEAVQKFIEVTHERYRQAVGEHFGACVPSIFTDEPQFVNKQCFRRSDDVAEVCLPFTEDFLDSYEQAYGEDLLDHIPELFWEMEGGFKSSSRYRYHDHVAERFASAYADQLGCWCDKNELVLTGHMMEEPTLKRQAQAVGDVMRNYRGFQLPGIDMLCDWREYNTAKQAQSASHQFGREGVASELYGVTGWGYPFSGHKCQGDWQAALGVTTRIHHLAWMTMAGEAKRDYPASIFIQSPWWREYRVVEDHFARVNTALTRGQRVVHVGIIHPVESYWLEMGPLDKTATERRSLDERFASLTEWLLFGQIDFDFISESLLPGLAEAGHEAGGGDSQKLQVGYAAYSIILVPQLKTIRSTTLELLEKHVDAGGRVIFAGGVPGYVDAEPSERACALARRCEFVPFDEAAIDEALSPVRDITVTQNHPEGEAALHIGDKPMRLLYQLRQDGDDRYLFICNTDAFHPCPNLRIECKGEWQAEELDTLTGEIRPFHAHQADKHTSIYWNAPAHGSLLVRLCPGRQAPAAVTPALPWRMVRRLDDPVTFALDEPNALLLDQAAWRFVDRDESWRPVEELLKIDERVRQHAGAPARDGRMAQPWAQGPDEFVAQVDLRFEMTSEVEIHDALFAMEAPASSRLWCNGKAVDMQDTGFYVDRAIRTIRLPSLPANKNELVLRCSVTRRIGLEWCYMLGDFGVRVRGRHTKLVALPQTLAFDNWVTQDLPFYTGNVTYESRINVDTAGDYALLFVNPVAPVICVTVDGTVSQTVAFSPYRAELGRLSAGVHRVSLTAFGHRQNSFGHIHNMMRGLEWIGPEAWRSSGTHWSYGYNLSPMGLTSAPILESKGDL